MNYKKLIALIILPFFGIKTILAHCPLCTAGAAVAIGGAAWLGVNKVVLGLFVGAFAVSMGWWFGKAIKKKYVPFQRTLLILLSFLLTVIPLLPLINFHRPLFLSFIGDYGKTYAVNLSLISSLFGGFIVTISPRLSKGITRLRKGKHINYQAMLTTFFLLIVFAIILQVII